MSKPKQHHYVHESYLSSFGTASCPFRVLDKWENNRIFPGTPENVMKEAQYYSQPDYEEGRLDPKLEIFFSTIESRWPSLLKKIAHKNSLSELDLLHFFEVLIMLRVRVPNARKAIEACLKQSVISVSGFPADNMPPKFSDHVLGHSQSAAEKMRHGSLTVRDMIDEGIIPVSIDPHRSLGLMSQFADSLRPTLRVLKYRSFLHNNTNTKFVTSDNPVLIYCPMEARNLPLPYPWKVTDDFCICFILSPEIAFYYNSREKFQPEHRVVRSENTVEKINELVGLFADRFLVSSTDGFSNKQMSMQNFCPVPNYTNSSVGPEVINRLSFEFGPPIKMGKWKYDFGTAH